MDRSEIVFFDVETTIENNAILQFGAILVCPERFTELHKYSTLVRPADLSLFSPEAIVASAPNFADIADTVYELLHERIWAGYNMLRFGSVLIREAFAEINRPPLKPKGTIDLLLLLTEKFGRRAGDMKVLFQYTYILWQVIVFTHVRRKGKTYNYFKSLDNARKILEMLKSCATVLFLESSLPDIFTEKSGVSSYATTNRSNGKSLLDGSSSNSKMKSMLSSPVKNQREEEKKWPTSPIPMFSSSGSKSNIVDADHIIQQQTCGFSPLRDEINRVIQPAQSSSSSANASKAYGSTDLVSLKPDEIFVSCLTASLVPLYRGSPRIQLLHQGVPFQLRCADLEIRFGINGKFLDSAGRPKLSFVVAPSQSLCEVLDACDKIAQNSCLESGSDSDWIAALIRKDGFFNDPIVRLHIPRAESGNVAIYAAEIYKKESSGTVQRLRFNEFDIVELGSLFLPGTYVDAVFSLDPFDHLQKAGIRLVAKKLTIHCV
ncbi:protein NEN1-like [Prosopis cineraria]|uniref:protein NEN1-like n=1 Tax=Prosopis cineraria TaxID=364024 RepID=UPI00240ED21E|nr:protein NEN1-like [Prosopis cineraria]